MRVRRVRTLRLVFVALTIAVVFSVILAGGAGAVVVRGANGQFFGVTPRAGVSPASIPGSVAARAKNGTGLSLNGNLDYHGGPVLHSSTPFLIYWDPSGHISSTSRALYQRYLTDSAAASGQGSNAFGVDRQYTDASGSAAYIQTFNPATQVINDTQAYPARDTVNCPNARISISYPNCVTDAQMRTEVARLILADGLPTGTSPNAPIYFVVTPTDVNVCQAFNGTQNPCADDLFCAYHSSFTDGANSVLYSPVAMLVLGSGHPKACQFDGHTAVQNPNGDPGLADVALKYLSHEDNETITDPLGNAWWNSANGSENGDNCNSINESSSAFTPTLGGDATAGTLYNQLINGHTYYTQSEWSNADNTCEMQPVRPVFTSPGGANLAGTAVNLNPSASAATGGYQSARWSFGDGSGSHVAAGALAAVQHSYASAGAYTVSLTLTDNFGQAATVSHTVTVDAPPTASFAASPAISVPGAPVSFDGTSSSDPNAGVPITAYNWNFGDGSMGSGSTASHAYSAAGTYTVTLTVTDSIGLRGTTMRQVIVDSLPTAVFGVPKSAVAGTPIAFSGSRSSTSQGSIAAYSWDFGDHHTGSGRAPKHTYSRAGHYTVTLTVRDSAGLTATVSHRITVGPSPISRLAVTRNSKGTFIQVSVTGPGVLGVGSSRSRVRRAGKISFKIALSRSLLAALHKHHKLTVNVKVKFVTRAGVTSTRTISVTFRG